MTAVDRAKGAGENAVLATFGLSRTDKRPPIWAHGRKITNPSMAQDPQNTDKKD